MGMTTDLALDIFKHPTDYFPSEREEAWDYATEVMQKYQKIIEIVERFKNQYDHTTSLDLMMEVGEVVEDATN